MAVATIRPNGNAIAQTWFDADFSYVDEEVNQPDAGGEDYANATLDDNNETFEVSFPDTIDDVDEVTNITIWTLGGSFSANPEIWLVLDWSTAEQQCEIPIAGDMGWTSNSFDGSWSQADLDSLVLIYRADGGEKGDTTWIDVAYAVVTYSIPAVGYAHKFLGIAPNRIGKVCGILTANVGKIKGR